MNNRFNMIGIIIIIVVCIHYLIKESMHLRSGEKANVLTVVVSIIGFLSGIAVIILNYMGVK